MPVRKTPLVSNHIYHVLNRGVNRIPIFNQKKDYQRFLALIDYCRYADYPVKFSLFKSLTQEKRLAIKISLKEKFIKLISYCLMPNHFHLILYQKKEDGIVSFINRLLTSYTKFFNTKYKRSGPLFDGRFRAVLVETDEQLLHLVRYVHLNPYSSALIKTSEELIFYPWSSFREYIASENLQALCDKKDIVISQFTNKRGIREFTLDQKDYQKELDSIKHLIEE